MIKIFKQNNKVFLKFGGENFNDILNICKENFLIWYDELKLWEIQKNKFEFILNELFSIEEVEYNKDLHEFVKPVLEVKKIRKQFNESLLKINPLKGKSPNENYQIEDIKNGISTNRILFGLEQRLGKTYISINIINHLFFYNDIDSCCIICPSHLIYNWRRELKRFFYQELRDEDIYIANVENREPFNSKCKFVIMGYRTFVMLSDDAYKINTGKKSKKYKNLYLNIKDWYNKRCIILDESQKIKGKSRQADIIDKYKDYFEYRYLLSGTPYPNSSIELYNQINFLDENIINMDYYTFLKNIANLGNRFSKYAINYIYKDKEIEFLNKVSPYIIRRFKNECLDLKDEQIKDIYCNINKKQLNIYRNLITQTLNAIKEEKGKIEVREVVNKFSYLQLALDNPCILKNKIDKIKSYDLWKLVEEWKFEEHSKLDFLTELIEEYIEENHKIIIWDIHPLTLNQLSNYYKKYDNVIIHGEILIDKKYSKNEYYDILLNKFKNDKNYKLAFLNPMVLSTGVNITESDRVIYFSRNYNLVDYLQSRARVTGFDQINNIIVNHLVLENSLDERVHQSLLRKEDLNKNLLNKDYLTKDEYKDLFEGRIL